MDAKLYVLDSYSTGIGRAYSCVAAVVAETAKTYTAHLRYGRDWSKTARRIMKDSAGGRFSTFEEANDALEAIRATKDEFEQRRRSLAAEERAAVDAILAGIRAP